MDYRRGHSGFRWPRRRDLKMKWPPPLTAVSEGKPSRPPERRGRRVEMSLMGWVRRDSSYRGPPARVSVLPIGRGRWKFNNSFGISRRIGRGGAIRTPDPLRPRQFSAYLQSGLFSTASVSKGWGKLVATCGSVRNPEASAATFLSTGGTYYNAAAVVGTYVGNRGRLRRSGLLTEIVIVRILFGEPLVFEFELRCVWLTLAC
jgi:hypothetical protein